MKTAGALTTVERERLMRAAGCVPTCAFAAVAERSMRGGENHTRVMGTHNGAAFDVQGDPPTLKRLLAEIITHDEAGEERG